MGVHHLEYTITSSKPEEDNFRLDWAQVIKNLLALWLQDAISNTSIINPLEIN